MLWVIFALLSGAAVFSVLWPLSRTPAPTDARDLDVAFYKAQTAEIERDTARGLIAEDDAEMARIEAGRRLVAASNRPLSAKSGAPRWLIVGVALATVAFVPLAAVGLYREIGAPDMPDQPLQARLNAPPAEMDMATAIARIEQRVAQDPNDGRGWSVLAPIYVRLQRYDDAQRAYRNAIRVLGPSGERYAALGEAEVFAGNGTVTPDARRDFEAAVKLDPRSPRASFYLGLAAEQDGDKTKAIAVWKKLLAESPADAPWVPTVRNHIEAAQGSDAPKMAQGAQGSLSGPLAAAVAAMPADQQQAMIHRMVDGLAQRLKTNGNDLDGWLRLVRAYRVMNEPDKAKVALADARRTFSADAGATRRIDDLAHELGLEG